MKWKALIFVSLLYSTSLLAGTTGTNCDLDRPYFNKKKDILIAQFDSKPDPDDIHSQAALGSMILHPDLKGVNVYAVSGAVGEQNGLFLDSRELFNAAFGKRWTAANEDWSRALEDIVDIVLPIIKKGGKVWVQEAGQSNFTAAWVREISKTLSVSTVKNSVIVVQHSNWNENQTNKDDLAYVKEVATYFSIDDGNVDPSEDYGKRDRGPYTTPGYRSNDSKWMTLAKESRNAKVRKLWILADGIIDSYFPDGFEHQWSALYYGGVDYSDCCENWWILNIGELADSHEKFWTRYVTK
ncbi:MAG: hypothetical protein R3Y51_03210 [Rikenellaceae bacterium]